MTQESYIFDNKTIIDITPLISPKTAVFPGDTAFSRSELLSFEKGHNLVLSSINSTVHIGAHTDAPSHYHSEGKTMESVSLEAYLGQCQVIEVAIEAGQRILSKDLLQPVASKRILLKTNSFPDPNNWNADFNSCSKELIEFLDSKGVCLVGIDTPSVDLSDDKELEAHNSIYKNKMAILEGIVLSNVDPGLYQLIALPLPIEKADASPVRAILIKE